MYKPVEECGWKQERSAVTAPHRPQREPGRDPADWTVRSPYPEGAAMSPPWGGRRPRRVRGARRPAQPEASSSNPRQGAHPTLRTPRGFPPWSRQAPRGKAVIYAYKRNVRVRETHRELVALSSVFSEGFYSVSVVNWGFQSFWKYSGVSAPRGADLDRLPFGGRQRGYLSVRDNNQRVSDNSLWAESHSSQTEAVDPVGESCIVFGFWI